MDIYKEIKAEERAYAEWERAEKNRILKMSSEVRKQEAWNKLFPPFAITGEVLTGDIF